MFHRIVETRSPFRPGYNQSDFDWLCAHLSSNYHVIDLEEFEERREKDQLSPNAVALTFDDGYGDNYDLAFPILSKYRLPATVFVTTGTVDGKSYLWTSKLSWILEHGNIGDPYGVLGVPISLETEHARLTTLRRLTERLKRVGTQEREQTIDKLEHDLGIADYSGLASDTLTWKQLREMDAQGFRSGAHTVNHTVLSKLTAKELDRELGDSKSELESRLGRPITTFAYPNGLRTDYDERAIHALIRHGYRSAYTTTYGCNTVASAPFELRRVSVYGETHGAIAVQLERFFYAHH